MKFITLTNKTLDVFIQRFVDVKDPAFDKKASMQGMRKTVWETMIQPMMQQKNGDVAFLNVLTKCQDVIAEVLEDPNLETAGFEDADFETMSKYFMEYNGWNPQLARVILIASDCIKQAQSGNTLGGKREPGRKERTSNR